MRLGYLAFLLILILVAAGAWFVSTKSKTAPIAPVVTTSTTSTATTTEPAPEPEPQATTAGLTQRILVNGIHITPLVVVEDSRCPVDVQCIQAGTVHLQAKLEGGGKVETATLTLGKPFSFAGTTVTLTKVTPSKTSKKPITPSDYQFEFSVPKLTPQVE